jgi:hypothetical protein
MRQFVLENARIHVLKEGARHGIPLAPLRRCARSHLFFYFFLITRPEILKSLHPCKFTIESQFSIFSSLIFLPHLFARRRFFGGLGDGAALLRPRFPPQFIYIYIFLSNTFSRAGVFPGVSEKAPPLLRPLVLGVVAGGRLVEFLCVLPAWSGLNCSLAL